MSLLDIIAMVLFLNSEASLLFNVCPNWVPFTSRDQSIHVTACKVTSASPLSWNEAKTDCMKKNASLANIVDRIHAKEVMSFIYYAFRDFKMDSSFRQGKSEDDSYLVYPVYINLRRHAAGGGTTFDLFYPANQSFGRLVWGPTVDAGLISTNTHGRNSTITSCGILHMMKTFWLLGNLRNVSVGQYSYQQKPDSSSPPSLYFVESRFLCTTLQSCIRLGQVYQDDVVKYSCSDGEFLHSATSTATSICEGGRLMPAHKCTPFFTCETAELQCQNAGTCALRNGTPSCLCRPGYYGRLCNHVTDECLKKPCLNNGTCIRKEESYTCDCMPGTSGQKCQHEENDCLPNPCHNNGTCVDRLHNYSCICDTDFDGHLCEDERNDCASSPCGASNACLYYGGTYKCVCSWGRKGNHCETKIFLTSRMEPDDVFVLVAATLLFSCSMSLCCLMDVTRKSETEHSNESKRPSHQDPDDVNNADPEVLHPELKNAIPSTAHRWDRVRIYVQMLSRAGTLAVKHNRALMSRRRYHTISRISQAVAGKSAKYAAMKSGIQKVVRLPDIEDSVANGRDRDPFQDWGDRKRSSARGDAVDVRKMSSNPSKAVRRRATHSGYNKVISWLSTCATTDFAEDPSAADPPAAVVMQRDKCLPVSKRNRRSHAVRWRHANAVVAWRRKGKPAAPPATPEVHIPPRECGTAPATTAAVPTLIGPKRGSGLPSNFPPRPFWDSAPAGSERAQQDGGPPGFGGGRGLGSGRGSGSGHSLARGREGEPPQSTSGDPKAGTTKARAPAGDVSLGTKRFLCEARAAASQPDRAHAPAAGPCRKDSLHDGSQGLTSFTTAPLAPAEQRSVVAERAADPATAEAN